MKKVKQLFRNRNMSYVGTVNDKMAKKPKETTRTSDVIIFHYPKNFQESNLCLCEHKHHSCGAVEPLVQCPRVSPSRDTVAI